MKLVAQKIGEVKSPFLDALWLIWETRVIDQPNSKSCLFSACVDEINSFDSDTQSAVECVGSDDAFSLDDVAGHIDLSREGWNRASRHATSPSSISAI